MSTVILFSSRLWKGSRKHKEPSFVFPLNPPPTNQPSIASLLLAPFLPALLLIPLLCYESAQRPNPLLPLSIWLHSILLHTLWTRAGMSGVPPWHLTSPVAFFFPRSVKWVSSPSSFLTAPVFLLFLPGTQLAIELPLGSERWATPAVKEAWDEWAPHLTHTHCENLPLLPSPAYLLCGHCASPLNSIFNRVNVIWEFYCEWDLCFQK